MSGLERALAVYPVYVQDRLFDTCSMKKRFLILRFIFVWVMLVSALSASAEKGVNDSLLKVLDGVIANRAMYLDARVRQIGEFKEQRDSLRSDREIYTCNSYIVDRYESFVSDSAKEYLNENLIIARRLRDCDLINESLIRMALIFAMNGQFMQARDIFDSVDYNMLPDYVKARFCWAKLKYLENLMISTDETSEKLAYYNERLALRDSLMGIFPVDTDLYRKELAARCRDTGDYKTALAIFLEMYNKETPDSHEAAMIAKGLADLFGLLGDKEQQERYLLISAIADIKMAVMENESLLALAEMLYGTGEIDRAYRYMRVALEDANFYNSRFKNSVIARVYPIVELSYLDRLNAQQRRISMAMWIMTLCAVIMIIVALMLWKQRRAVTRSRTQLAYANKRLERASVKLAEANLIRERYVGYFMHQCSINVDKLDKFRININRKLKANQIEDAYVMSSRPLEKELEELYENFDKAFLNLYPNFIDEFNSLLLPESRFSLPKDRLNTPVRIFALIRLGITDMSQIANFLHYSVQTVYNYKSKVRRTSILAPEEFDEKVKKIGTLAQ